MVVTDALGKWPEIFVMENTSGRSNQDQKVSNRALNQSSLLPVLGHPPDSRTLFTTSELYLFYVLSFYVCFVSSHVEVLREGNC